MFNSKKKRIKKATEPVIGLLKTQLTMFGISKKDIPSRAEEPFSLGYILGMLDATLTLSGIEDFESAMKAMGFAFREIFGQQKGYDLSLKAIDHLENEQSEFQNGLREGGTEFTKFVQKEINAPLGWSGYVMNVE